MQTLEGVEGTSYSSPLYRIRSHICAGSLAISMCNLRYIWSGVQLKIYMPMALPRPFMIPHHVQNVHPILQLANQQTMHTRGNKSFPYIPAEHTEESNTSRSRTRSIISPRLSLTAQRRALCTWLHSDV